MSAAATRVLGDDPVQEDLMPALTSVVDQGWFELDGAYLLKAWHESYYGPRQDVKSYEFAVNGRGIPDLDIEEAGDARAKRLLTRGIVFARAALRRARADTPRAEIAAAVSAAPVLTDPDRITGYVTFWTVRPDDWPAVDPGAEDMVVRL